MCIANHLNFYYDCGHIQIAHIPAVEGGCDIVHESLAVILRACPRCHIIGRLKYAPRYTQEGPGAVCNGISGMVTRTIRIERQNPGMSIHEQRAYWARKLYLYRQAGEWDRYLLINATEVSERKARRALTYYIRASDPGDINPSQEFYAELPWYFVIPDNKNVCAICRGTLLKGAYSADRCQGNDYVDEADNEVSGLPVELPCGHIFGLGCIRSWIEGSNSNRCPTCQYEFTLTRQPMYVEHPMIQEDSRWATMSLRGKAVVAYQTFNPRAKISTFFTDLRRTPAMLWNDIDHWVAWKYIIVYAYYQHMFMYMPLLCPQWYSWTNVAMGTIGPIGYWWTRRRPLSPELNENITTWILIGGIGNMIEWIVESMARGWFARWSDFYLFPHYMYLLFWVKTKFDDDTRPMQM